jgi:hypothetical protein
MFTRHLLLIVVFAFIAVCAFGQQFVVVEPNGTIASGNFAPTVVRTAPGFYRVTLPNISRFVLVTSQTGGVGGDVGETIATVRFDTNNRRVLFINVKEIGVGAGGATVLRPRDGRFSLEVRLGS